MTPKNKIVFSICLSSVLLSLAEVGTAVLRPQATWRDVEDASPPIWRDDPAGFGVRPGARATIRQREFTIDVAADSSGLRVGPAPTRSLAVVGDSFAWGHGVQTHETVAALLRGRNAGYIGGCAPDGYRVASVLGRIEGLGVRDLVVLVYLGNDLQDRIATRWTALDSNGLPTALRYAWRVDEDGRFRGPVPWRYSVPILSRSQLFLALGAAVTYHPQLDEDQFFWGPDMRNALADQARCLRDVAGRHRGRTLVVLVPTIEQVRGGKTEARDAWLTALGGLVVLDLLPTLTGKADIYYPMDKHWTTAGHALVAKNINSVLTSR